MASYCDNSPFSSPMEYIDIAREGSSDPTVSDVLKEGEIVLFVNGMEYAKLSCTPSDIEDLVVGKLFSDGMISQFKDICDFEHPNDHEDGSHSINVILNDLQTTEGTLSHSAALVRSEDALNYRFRHHECRLEPYTVKPYNVQDVFYLYDDFVSDTPLHSLTSGTHSCRVFYRGKMVYVSEDIGRHNALDKAIGYLIMNGIDPREVIIFSTGRVPSDMAKKAIHAKVAVLATKAAPTDRAIMLAKEYGLNLVCLVKSDHLRLYTKSCVG